MYANKFGCTTSDNTAYLHKDVCFLIFPSFCSTGEEGKEKSSISLSRTRVDSRLHINRE